MTSSRRTPSLLISTSHPARPVETSPSTSYQQSQSPFRYLHYDDHLEDKTDLDDEKAATPLVEMSPKSEPQSLSFHAHRQPSLSSSPVPHSARTPITTSYPAHIRPQSSRTSINATTPTRSSHSSFRTLHTLIRPWIPIILYASTSLGFLVTIAFFKQELFTFLDELSSWLRTEREYGYALLFLLIFITTFPPMPLYSTLIILSGYTFGPWTGAVLSYLAALTGALTVFIISRTLLRRHIADWLDNTCSLKRVVCAIEKRPKLLFLIRLAPYPYNVMNCLLAAAPSLTLRTYTLCTALSLFKVIIHTSLGASIHSFKDYHVSPSHNSTLPGATSPNADNQEETSAGSVARIWTIVGVVMCVLILGYLSYVARKAVNEELGGDESSDDAEENVAFLSPQGISDLEMGINSESAPSAHMAESPLRSMRPLSASVSSPSH